MRAETRGYTWLVAKRELLERARAKSFKVATVILLLAVAVGVILPAVLSGHKSAVRVGIVDGGRPAQTVVLEAARITGTAVRTAPEPALGAGEIALRNGAIDVLFVPGHEVLLKQLSGGTGTSAASTLAGALAQLAGEQGFLATLPPAALKALEHGLALPVRGLLPPPRSLTERVTGFVSALIIYLLVLTYGMRLTVATQEEKSSRVAEVLLAAIRPSQLLMGKVIGMGLLFLGQIVALLLTAVVAGELSGSKLLQGSSPALLAVAAVWFLLGYAFYCTTFAAAGAMITRQADSYNATLPMQIPLIVGYLFADFASFGSVTPLERVLGFLPPTAPVIGPALYASGSFPLWQMGISAALCIASTVLVSRVAGTVYSRSLLRTGGRVHLREVLGAGAL